MRNVAPSVNWLGLRASVCVLASMLALLALAGTVLVVHGEEEARPGRAARCLGADCAPPPMRGVTVYRGLVLDYEVIDGLAVHGGDMILGTAEEAAAAAPSREPAQRTASPGDLVRRDLNWSLRGDPLWPDGRVPYVIDEGTSEQALERIHAAIEEWNSKTVITWFPRTDEEDYALFLPRRRPFDPCSSVLGKAAPTRIYTVDCPLSTTIHEMGHAVGLLHEHQRIRLRDFFALAPGHLSPGAPQGPFWSSWRSMTLYAFGERPRRWPFDYRSIMLYSGRPSLVGTTLPPGIPIRPLRRLSPGDIDGIARLYGKPPETITVSTNPPGLDVLVDGDRVTTPVRLEWLPGSVHTLEAPVAQQHHVFGSWNDGGRRQRTVQADPEATWFEANFIPRIELRPRVFPPNAGTVALSPELPDRRFTRGTRFGLTPSPTAGTPYEFAHWSPDNTVEAYYFGVQPYSGSALRPEARTYYPENFTAVFARPPFLRINSNAEKLGLPVNVNGLRLATPVAFPASELPAGSKVSVPESVQVLDPLGSGGRYRFTGWSDGGEREHEIAVPARGGSLTFQVQREFQLITDAYRGEIVVSPASEDGFYPVGTQVQLTAMPFGRRHFLGWEHDVSGPETTQFVIMDRDRRVHARFVSDEPTLVQSGEPLQVDSGISGHYVRVPDGTSQVAVRFESSSPPRRDAELHVWGDDVYGHTVGSTRLVESDTITATRDKLSFMRDRARTYRRASLHLSIYGPSVGSGQLHVSIQRDWIAHIWPRAFTMVAPAGWSRPVRQTMRIVPVEEVEGKLPPVRYRIVSDQPWLEAVPAEWTSAEGAVEIAVQARGAALTAEAYGGKLKILTVRAGDPPTGGTPTGLKIPVHFVVMPAEGTEEPTGDGSGSLADGDDHGDRRGAATEIAAGTATQGRLERVGDEDWFRFRTTGANTWVTAYTDSAGDTVGELHAAGGAVVADDDSGSDWNFRIAAAVVPAGTHYVRVSGFGTPAYTLTLEAVSDDHGDTKGTATEIAAGTAARGRLQAAGDEDWFRFRTTGASTWVTAYTVSKGDTVGELHLAGGAVVAHDNSRSYGNFGVLANVPAGTHYVRVSGSGTLDYTLRLEAGSGPIDLMEFVRIEAGSFLMGSPEDEEGRSGNERQHEVRIS